MDSKLPTEWKCLEEKVFLDFPYLQIVERLCQKTGAPRADDSEMNPPHRYYVIKSRDWCNVIPITEEGKIVLVRQFRAGTHDTPYEFPGGVIEEHDEDPGQSALRELLEETGYAPTDRMHLKYLGSANPNPALQDNRVHSFVVSPVKKIARQNLDVGEDVVVEEKSIDEFVELYRAGKFSHALMLTSLFFLIQSTLKDDGIRVALKKH